MKAISILGTSSNAGKSWVATALCASLRRRGFQVAPFKAQSVSNNSFVTLTGGEIGRAQAAQAEACGLEPTVEMNPILLKPTGAPGSQLVLLGKAQGHFQTADYDARVETLWQTVAEALDGWRSQCDVLVVEGAGSPVELNLMARDLANLRPCEALDGRWLLVADIERGGVFAQIVGTWALLPEAARARGLGAIVNQFRGDLALFANAGQYLGEQIELPYLGVIPRRDDLRPEDEDNLCHAAQEGKSGAPIAWIEFPHLSNSQDNQPWRRDRGAHVRWVRALSDLHGAQAIVLPGSKNTIADLAWLRKTGLAAAIVRAANQGMPVLGICAGYQMLGFTLTDAEGVAGDQGTVEGLGLLPVDTLFHQEKTVRQVQARWGNESWKAYEIHMGQTSIRAGAEGVLEKNGVLRAGNIWGSYLHGLFEGATLRAEFARGIPGFTPTRGSWREEMRHTYNQMADLLETHVDLTPVWRYVES